MTADEDREEIWHACGRRPLTYGLGESGLDLRARGDPCELLRDPVQLAPQVDGCRAVEGHSRQLISIAVDGVTIAYVIDGCQYLRH